MRRDRAERTAGTAVRNRWMAAEYRALEAMIYREDRIDSALARRVAGPSFGPTCKPVKQLQILDQSFTF